MNARACEKEFDSSDSMKRYTKHILPVGMSVLLAIVVAIVLFQRRQQPLIPVSLAADLSADCCQVLLVLSPQPKSVSARMWLMQRANAQSPWRCERGPVAVSLGRNGLAWGIGEHRSAAPYGFAMKREGDGCSPAGVFRLPFAFGYAAFSEAGWVRLPYVHVTATLFGVDDMASRYYNQVIDATTVTCDWNSDETMLRADGLYRWGAFVANNPANERGAGSCIFLHIWRGPGKPTAGCTTMPQQELQHVLAWLDVSKSPRLVQSVTGW